MNCGFPDQQQILNASIRAAQFLSGITSVQNVRRETGRLLGGLLGTDVVAFAERSADGSVSFSHWTYARVSDGGGAGNTGGVGVPDAGGQDPVTEDMEQAAREVLDNGFLVTPRATDQDPYAWAFLPISEENRVTSVLVVGHLAAGQIPKDLLDVYLAVAGLVGTTTSRLSAEAELERHRRDLEDLVSERTAELTESNRALNEEVAKRRTTEERMEHLNRVLRAIRNVNQLITSEKDPRRLVQRACDSLAETMGYLNAWVALLENNGEACRSVSASAAAGFGCGCNPLHERLVRDDYPLCMKKALECNTTVVVENPQKDCPGCSVSSAHADRAGLSRCLAFDDQVYGVLTVSVPRSFARDPEERDLFDELAEDLSFALHRIEVTRDLERQRRRYREIFERSRDGFVMVDSNGRIIDANNAFCRMLGYSPEELRALPDFYQITPERWREWEREEIWEKRLLGHGYSGLYEKEYIRKDGSIMPVELRAYVVRREGGEIDYLWGTARDITERKQAERELRESEALLDRSQEIAAIGSFVWDLRDDSLVWSRNMYTIHGLDEDTFAGNLTEVSAQLIHPEDRSRVWAEIGQMVENGKVKSMEFRITRKDGVERIMRSGGEFELDEDGTPIKCFGVHQDITEQKRIESRNRLLAAIIERSRDFIGVSDRERRAVYVNPAGRELVGLQDGAAVERSRIEDYFRPEDLSFFHETILPALEEKGRWSGEFRLRNFQTGQPVDVLYDLFVVEDPDTGEPTNYATVTRDITEQLRTAAMLEQAQRMESVGRLAGGIAHDFNNMLSVILGHTEMILEDIPRDHPETGRLAEIQRAAQRSADLTRQLLAFARRQTVAPKVLNLNDTVESMLRMLRRLIGEDIDLLWVPGRAVHSVRMDPAQIDQVLANLCVNARDAVGHSGGKVTIETATAEIDEEYSARHPYLRSGRYVVLAVSDNGRGMDEETKNRVFEPFFTTKGVGEGTGLGLATVYGIVKQNDGFINVYSEPRRGTTFKLYFPAHESEGDGRQGDSESAAELPQGHETILLVEDEPSILDMTRMMLERLGYRVLHSKDPGKAVDIARQHTGEVDLLITDVVMPDMNGRELAGMLSQSHPGLKRLFMSGYTANVIAHHGVLEEGVSYIQKPFSREQLAAKVREALDE